MFSHLFVLVVLVLNALCILEGSGPLMFTWAQVMAFRKWRLTFSLEV